jgi:type III pantothenate kinase
MNLVIDVGNTLVKMAIFDQDKIIQIRSYASLDTAAINGTLKQFPAIKACIIGSVRDLPNNLREEIIKPIRFLVLDSKTKLPIQHRYTTFDTLGADRIAGVVAANHLFPAKNILIIEAGTCITYDFIDAGGIYYGGGISPGIHLRFAALHNFTDKLPLIEPVKDPVLIGNSTETSIQSGVINGVKAEVWGIISSYEDNYENLTIILSGGNLDYFDKTLKNNIFAVPNIVLTGLNIILAFNDKT